MRTRCADSLTICTNGQFVKAFTNCPFVRAFLPFVQMVVSFKERLGQYPWPISSALFSISENRHFDRDKAGVQIAIPESLSLQMVTWILQIVYFANYNACKMQFRQYLMKWRFIPPYLIQLVDPNISQSYKGGNVTKLYLIIKWKRCF